MFGVFKIEFFAELSDINSETFEVKHRMNVKINGLMTPEMVRAIAEATVIRFGEELATNVHKCLKGSE